MWWSAKDIKSFVATENIAVVKLLKSEKCRNQYQIPDTDYVVHGLNSLVISQNPLCFEEKNVLVTTATLDKTLIKNCEAVDGSKAYFAYVPEGSTFFVNPWLNELVANKLFVENGEVSKEEMKDGTLKHMRKNLAKAIINNGFDRNNASVGWILLSDKTFVHPFDYEKHSQTVIGIVSSIKYNGGLEIMGLGYSDPIPWNSFGYFFNYDLEDRVDMFCGEDYCEKYETEGTQQGEWHLPSFSEVIGMYKNLTLINASLLWIYKYTFDEINIWARTYEECSRGNHCIYKMNGSETEYPIDRSTDLAVAIPFLNSNV